MMQFIEHLLLIGQTWTGATATLLTIVLLLVLRRLLPTEQRKRGTVTLFFLWFAFGFGLSATAALKMGAYTLWGVLSFLDLLSLVCGVTGLASLVVFDLILPRLRVRVPSLVRDLISLSVVVLIVLTILYQRGLDPLSLVTTSAVLTAVFGLALQSTIANVFAGLALHTDRTVGIGDWVQAGSMIGRIDEIKWRSTSLRTEDGDLVIMPNSQLLDAEVQNLSRPDAVHRMWVKVGFHYRHPPNEVKRVLLEAIRDTPGVRPTPAPDCILFDFADSAITYALRYWISDFTHHTAIESEVRTRIWYAARRSELEIPFPIRTIVMPTIATEAAAVVHPHEVADHLVMRERH
jgi:small-conductance mechanosensitive channel